MQNAIFIYTQLELAFIYIYIGLSESYHFSLHLAAQLSDTGMGVLLLFASFFGVLISVFGLSHMSKFVKRLRKTAIQARKFVGHCQDNFTKYVSCPKCHYVYDLDICKIRMPEYLC